jgi:CelD/BcsL family acetyltransferase involved in cellulose biosynthesis
MQALMDLNYQIIEGAGVDALISEPEFLAQWQELAAADTKLTVIQEPAFVSTWYGCYREVYTPVLVLARDDRGRLAGLMPLALDGGGQITHAGHHQAEYHGWICRPELEQEFPLGCLQQVARRFRPGSWSWRWMPPGAALDPAALAERGIHVQLQLQDSPQLDLTDQAKLKRILRNRSLKTKANRYKKRGEFRLERITDPRQAQQLLPQLANQCDFRQEAVHGAGPFASDPRKAAFYLARLRFGEANHFTVLWCGEQPLAFHFGACTADTVIWGLSAYDPREGRNSPGSLLLVELVKLMQQEGRRFLDLTPGGDAYKERFSNTHESLQMPTFHFTRRSRALAWARRRGTELALRAADRLGLPREELRIAGERVRKRLTAVRTTSPARALGYLAQQIFERRTVALYRLDPERTLHTGPAPDREVKVQDYACLLDYKGGRPWLPRRELLSRAMYRLSAGERLYTISRDGRLANCGWARDKVKRLELDGEQPLELPEGSVLLHDLFTDYSEHDCQDECLCSRNLQQMVDDSLRDGAKEVYASVDSRAGPVRDVLEQGGFTLHRQVTHKRLLFWRV